MRASLRALVGVLAFAASAAPLPAAAQSVGETRGSQFPFLPVHARAAAFGDASGALTGSLEGVSSNPALLSWIAGPQVMLTFNRLSPDVSHQSVACAFPTGASTGLAFHIGFLHPGQFNFLSRADLRSQGFELQGGASFATRIADDLAFGLTANVRNATTDADPVWSFTGDLGFAYAPTRYHTFGLTVRDWGTDYAIDHPVLPPDIADARPQRALSLSAAFTYPLDESGRRIIVAFENDKMIGRTGILYKAGLECRLVQPVALRAGLQVRSGDVEPRAGGGFLLGPVSLDYAWRCLAGGVPSHVFTLGYVPLPR